MDYSTILKWVIISRYRENGEVKKCLGKHKNNNVTINGKTLVVDVTITSEDLSKYLTDPTFAR